MKTCVAVTLVIIMMAPMADQCDQLVFARSNPGLCYTGPFGSFPGANTGGGGSGGGLWGTIGHILGGLTGGLL